MNRDTLRLFATAAFAFCALVLYQRWELYTRPVQESATGTTDIAAPERTESVATPGQSELPEVAPDLALGSQGELPQATEDATPTIVTMAVTVSNDSVRAYFDDSGSMVRMELLKHSVTLDGEPLAIIISGQNRKLTPQTGLLGDGLPNHLDEGWTLEPTAEGSGKVTARWSKDGITVRRSYHIAESGYLVTLAYEIENATDGEVTGHAYFQFLRDSKEPLDYSAKVPSFYGAAVYTDEGKYSKHDYDEFEAYPRRVSDGWIALVQRYFMVAWLDSGELRDNFMRNLANGDIAVGVTRAFKAIEPGGTLTVTQPMYTGALEQDLLKAIDPALGKDIKLAVDYGWLTFLAAPLFSFLAFIHDLAGNWGFAIILLTLFIKLAFFPLSAKSYKSMARMKNVAPQMQKLKERYGDDRQELQKATMELYRKEKINPLGGCLPILIQIPVFIALYWMLLEAVELRQAPFGVWIRDLSSPDPFFVLPLLLGVSMYGQFKLNPTPPDPTQAMIMKIMPIGFAAFSIIMPSGLVLYWITNTLLSIAQQWQITRTIATEKPAKKN